VQKPSTPAPGITILVAWANSLGTAVGVVQNKTKKRIPVCIPVKNKISGQQPVEVPTT